MSIKTVTFDSLEQLVEQVKSYGDAGRHHEARTEGNKTFWGTNSIEETYALAVKGWAEGARRVAELRTELDAIVEKVVAARVQQQSFDLTGEYLDIGRYLTGEPEVWGSYVDAEGGNEKGRVIKIKANLAASCAVSRESLFSRGAAVAAAVDLLETLGHRVELWACTGSKTGVANILETHVLIKSAGQPLDVDRLAFVLCNASCLRRLFFSHDEANGWKPCYSFPHPIAKEEGAVVTGEALRGNDFSKRERIRQCIAVCRQCGVSVEQDEVESLLAGCV